MILITGGGGFIGSHLAERLCRSGHAVRVLDNFSTGRRSNLAPIQDAVDLVEGDMTSYERVHRAVRGCDVVFAIAAIPSVPRSIQDPLTSHAANVTALLNVLLAARDEGVRRVIFASSSSIYGSNPELPKREDARPMPISPYAVAKLAGEGYCRSFSEVYGLHTTAIRYFNVFGPRQDPQSQYAAVIPKFIQALHGGEQPVIYGDGEQSRDFTYVDNVVDANLLAMGADLPPGRVFNVACGERITLNHFAAELRELMDSSIEPIYAEPRSGDIRHSLADISRAREEFGYEPFVGFREGLSRTIDSVVRESEREYTATPS